MEDMQHKRVIIGERLKALRKEQKITQVQLAEAIQEHPTYISRWENGNLDIGVPQLYKLATYFKVSVLFLLGEDIKSREKELGQIIKSKRKLKGLELYDMAKLLKGKIDPLRLNNIENGTTQPTQEEIESIANVLNIDPNILVRDDEQSFEIIKRELYRLGLPEDDIKAIDQHIKFKLYN